MDLTENVCQISELRNARLAGFKPYVDAMRTINAELAHHESNKLELESLRRRRIAATKQHELAKQGLLGIDYPGEQYV